MLQLYPCKDDHNYNNCSGRMDDCYVCIKNSRGEAKICNELGKEPCPNLAQCLKETKAYKEGRGGAPEGIIFCETFLEKRKNYIRYLIKAWHDIPNKQKSVSFISMKVSKGVSHDFFNDYDFDVLSDKSYLDDYLIPDRLEPVEKKIISMMKDDYSLRKIAKATKFTKKQVEDRFEKILELLAFVKEDETVQKFIYPPIKPDTRSADEIMHDVFVEGKARRYPAGTGVRVVGY